MRCYLWCYL